MSGFHLGKIPIPGFRNIKTCVSVLCCLLLYHLIGRDGVVLASIAAIICMQDSVEKSIKEGGNRILGTMLGGLFGIVFSLIDFKSQNFYLFYVFCVFGLMLLIYIFNIIKKRGSISIGCVVYLIIMLDQKDAAPIIYSLNRVLDTIIGISFAVAVNALLFRPKAERVPSKGERIALDYEIKKSGHYKVSKWDGGTTEEICIFPKYALYSDRNFIFRISTAVIELPESRFTKLSGYMRHIMILDGKVKLIHKGRHTINLDKFEQDFFKGDWDTGSVGQCTDFNLILQDGVTGELHCVDNMGASSLVCETCGEIFDKSGFYILSKNVKISVYNTEKTIFDVVLNRGDFIIFNDLMSLADEGYFISLTSEALSENTVLAVRANITDSIHLH